MKLTTFAITLCAGSLAFGSVSDKTSPEAYRAMADAVLSQRTVKDASAVAATNGIWKLTSRDDLSELRHTIDGQFAGKGVPAHWTSICQWPKASKLSWDMMRIEQLNPVLATLQRKYQCQPTPLGFIRAGVNLQELISLFQMNIRPLRFDATPSNVTAYRNAIVSAVRKPIREYLRSHGLPYEKKGGIDPVTPYVNDLAKRLYSAYFDGVDDWFATYELPYSLDTSLLIAKETRDQTVSKIINGEERMCLSHEHMLKMCLGSVEYAKFIRRVPKRHK